MYESFKETILNHNKISARVYKLPVGSHTGVEMLQPQLEIKPDIKSHQNKISLINKVAKTEVGFITLDGAIRFFNHMMALGYKKSTYGKVKDDDTWRKVYNVSHERFDYGVKGVMQGQRFHDSAFCRGGCGIRLPLDNLTVDHQKPQVGGEDAALFRVFRGYGLTIGGPQGVKGLDYIGYASSISNGTIAGAGTKADRYTTNNAGTIYYSVMKLADQLTEFKKLCMHHYLNLAPVCGYCNSSKGNKF